MSSALGWFALQQSAPINPLSIIELSQVISGVNTDDGKYYESSTYATPTGGTWIDSPFAISSVNNFRVSAVDLSNYEQILKARSMNQSIQYINTSTSLCKPLRSLVYLVGNSGRSDWMMNIPIDLGGLSYSYLEIGILENAATFGDVQGKYPVLRFDQRTYTGTISLGLVLSRIGSVRIGIRAENTGNQSSMFELNCIVLSA
ncbi:MAG: hypothetical protein ACK5C0_10940 [Candidatus Kapaibacterium sp.]|jgi:hypothetical protein